MKAAGLPARIVYTVIALPLAGAAGFYSGMAVLPQLVARYPQIDPASNGRGIFDLALSIGALIALTAGLLALTLPWSRHRKRRGRPWRTAVSLVMVLVVSTGFADVVPRLALDLLFAVWLAYTMAYTFVRYGILDETRRPASSRYY